MQFAPEIQNWFDRTYPSPTDAQAQAWPLIANGENVLVTAPTGSGKTLTAFLWALNQLLTRAWDPDEASSPTRVLYISPLKALNNDIQRNLVEPLAALQPLFPDTQIRVATRSGDTPQSERRRMLRKPPDILITTPESLNLLLSSQGGRTLLTGIRTVILDEIHAVFGSKRGVHLISAVDRLVRLSGDFQRIALSATVRPIDTVAAFVAGLHANGKPRPIRTVISTDSKSYDLKVRYIPPPEPEPNMDLENPEAPRQTDEFWLPIIEEMRDIIDRNQSTLFFVNSRRTCEKLTFLVNQDEPEPLAFAHHGSLSREIRTTVEHRMKAGDLPAIIATSSLELGIDIGSLDEVVLVQSPPGIAAATQRLGRAGHQVGETSRGTLFPVGPRDILEAGVLTAAVLAGDLEPTSPVDMPLDVLAQHIISMTGTEVWDLDELYASFRCSHPFRKLTRDSFDRVLDMLAGRYVDTRIRELSPRIIVDKLDNTAIARRGALLTLYSSGGVIPDRGYYKMRHQETGARIGELDEEFVWEARVGQTFSFGTQNWRIQRITHDDVYVIPGSNAKAAPPFWRADGMHRDFHFAERVLQFLEEADTRLKDEAFWQAQVHLDEPAREALLDWLLDQRDHTGTSLPHRHHVVVEHIESGPDGSAGKEIVLHTGWGGEVNEPFALALEAAWKRHCGQELRTYASNYSITLVQEEDLRAEELLNLVRPDEIESLLRERLEASGFFGARFREAAGISLMLPKRRVNERLPLWMSRLKSQKLLEAVSQTSEFPVLLEAWRSCLRDAFDLEHLKQLLAELQSGAIALSHCKTFRPSPFAAADAWRQVNLHMYMDDSALTSGAGGKSSLSDELIRELTDDPTMRPRIPRAVATEFEQKRQRLAPGYAPETAPELVDWVRERVVMPAAEFDRLVAAIDLDPEEKAAMLAQAEPKLCRIDGLSKDQPRPLVHARERDLSALTAVESDEQEDEILAAKTALLAEWLSFYGPVADNHVWQTLGINDEDVPLDVVRGKLTDDADVTQRCDRATYEILLRMTRARARPQIQPRPLAELTPFLATWQNLHEAESGIDGLRDALERLACLGAPAALWERELLPARVPAYAGMQLDTVLREGTMHWAGSGEKRLTFCFGSELDLLPAREGMKPLQGVLRDGLPARREEEQEQEENQQAPSALSSLFPDPHARYDLAALKRHFSGSLTELREQLWSRAWQGELSTDSFAPVREGVANKFEHGPRSPAAPVAADSSQNTPQSAPRAPRRGRRARTSGRRWSAPTLPAGSWFPLPLPPAPDLLEQQEQSRERVRILLDRYGILFRELLQREAPGFRWRDIFRSLRLMEFSGELTTGYFFEGVPGPQFVTPRALGHFQRAFPERVFWLCAADPISLCGLGLPHDSLPPELPRRLPGNHLVYRGNELVLRSENHAQRLRIDLRPEDPDLPAALGVLHHLLERDVQPRSKLRVESINGDDPNRSEFLPLLQSHFDVQPDYKKIYLHRRLR